MTKIVSYRALLCACMSEQLRSLSNHESRKWIV